MPRGLASVGHGFDKMRHGGLLERMGNETNKKPAHPQVDWLGRDGMGREGNDRD
jgi:hypothetical protein